MSQLQAQSSYVQNLVPSLVTAGTLLVAERYLSSKPQAIFDMDGLKRAGQAVVVDYISYPVTDRVVEMMSNPVSPSAQSALCAVVGGGLYSGANYFSKWDDNSPLYSFLYFTGSKVASNFYSGYLSDLVSKKKV